MTDTKKWFGESWGAKSNVPETHSATPVGEKCPICLEPIRADDQGFIIPVEADEPTLFDVSRAYHAGCWITDRLHSGKAQTVVSTVTEYQQFLTGANGREADLGVTRDRELVQKRREYWAEHGGKLDVHARTSVTMVTKWVAVNEGEELP